MTVEHNREKIEAINVLLNKAYDSTLDEIIALLKLIEEESDLRAYDQGMEDIRINGTVPWEEVKKELV
jgi:hypothetical protein